MQKRIASLLVTTLVLLAACSGGTSDQALPTLAQLPTNLPGTTAVPATANAVTAPVATGVPTDVPASAATDDQANAPAEPTSTLLPIPDASQPSIFPTLVAGQDTTLQGKMTTIDNTHAKLTDSNGNTVIVLVDPIAGQIGANHVVLVHGTVAAEGDHVVLQMSEIKILDAATPEATPG